ncbi:MAG: NAD(P)/FAD-dependent oxidoreductase [Dysgonamonadaceae bacterium]|jgi:protoporphyrinogen oxidase|nr:NAD(P)/FAD-dependent oxidoreductase [Dysgonamonadaceae bacterium]
MNKKAIIIGAGPAGLTAAYRLRKTAPDVDVAVFEATERIGGISTTINHNGNRMDIGGHRFFSKSKIVNDLWNEIMPVQSSAVNPEKTDNVMLIRNRVSRIFFRRKFFDYPISIKPATFRNMGLVNTVKSGFSYLVSAVGKRPENSLEDFYINRFGKHLYRMFFEDYTEKVWGVHPSKLSPSWGAQRVKELSVLAIIKEIFLKIFAPHRETKQTSLIERFLYPKFGPGQLWEIAAAKAEEIGAEIRLNSIVTGIQAENGKIRSVTVNCGGKTENFSCDYLFSTMPVKDLAAAMGNAVPEAVRRIAADLSYRDFITVGLLVKRLKLKNETKIKTVANIIPDCWIYVQERDVRIGRLQIFNNWSPYMAADNENTVWIGLEYFSNEGDELWNMPEKEFIDFAVNELAKIGIIDESDVLDSVQVKYPKAYPSYFGSYSEFDVVRNYLDGIENLYCIGRNGQHRYNNQDHSMLTAIEAVNLLKSGETDKSAVWNVNTETEYHEGK